VTGYGRDDKNGSMGTPTLDGRKPALMMRRLVGNGVRDKRMADKELENGFNVDSDVVLTTGQTRAIGLCFAHSNYIYPCIFVYC